MSAGTQPRSRAQNVLHNLMSSAVSKALVLFLSFIARSVFIRYLSEVYLGVNGLYSNVLNMLSLAELGFGTAMVFSMYRPLAEHDDRKLAALLRVYRRAYTVIGCVVFAIGLSLVPVLHLLIKLPADMQLGDLTLSLGGRQLTVSYVNFYYLLFLLNAAVSYWFWGYRRSVFVADQKEHICTNIRSILSILRAAADCGAGGDRQARSRRRLHGVPAPAACRHRGGEYLGCPARAEVLPLPARGGCPAAGEGGGAAACP